MTITASQEQLEERLADLDRRLKSVESAVGTAPIRTHRREVDARRSVPPPRRTTEHQSPSPIRDESTPPQRPVPDTLVRHESTPLPRPVPGTGLGDLVGGRLLAWIGGAATLVGIVLFLALAVSRGWIGIEARVILAGLGSSLLMGGGVWLHDKRGRTEASMVLVGVATAGLFATLLVASRVYGLIAPEVAFIASVLVGALATWLAIRWAGYAIAAIGLIGALISPVLVDVPVDALTVAILAGAAACATWTTIAQRWNWLGVATVLVCAPQWARFLLGGQPLAIDLAVLVWFGGLGLVGAMAGRYQSSDEGLRASAAVLLTLNAVLVAVLGANVLRDVAWDHGPAIWLGVLAIVYTAAGFLRLPRLATPVPLRRLALVNGLVLADVALGLAFSGLLLAGVWAATSIGFAVITRRQVDSEIDRRLLQLGVGAHIALTLVRVVLLAPPSGLGAGTPQLAPLVALALLATSCLVCGQLLSTQAKKIGAAINALGLLAIAYLTATALSGPALAAAWALEGLSLIQLGARTKDHQARWGAAGFLALAVAHALSFEAPPNALVIGVNSLPAAALALGAIALTIAWSARLYPDLRKWLVPGTLVTLIYLGSVAIITVFQPAVGIAGGDVGDAVLDLTVRQRGQVLLSACWSLVGLGGLIFGLRRKLPSLRNASLVFLLITVAKVFLYDLSTLTSIYRVVSFIAVGLLLLVGAFVHQRLRPPPVPDMRSVHPSQR